MTRTNHARTRRSQPKASRSRGRIVCCEMARPVHAAQVVTTDHSHRGVPIAKRNWPVYQNVLEGLRLLCPPALPVVVRSGRLAAWVLGSCVRDKNRFVIRLSHELDEAHAVETLVHEWAHALAWSLECDRLTKDASIPDDDFQEQSHGPSWGVAYARTWQTFLRILAVVNDGRG